MKLTSSSSVINVLVGIGLAVSGSSTAWGASPSTDSSTPTPAPSFNCAHVKSSVLHLVCTTPKLASLDAQLGEIFQNTSGQAGIDAKALRKSEDLWLTAVRDKCADAACLESAYTHRIATLKDQSLQAASPAAYAQTRPFAVSPGTMAHARGLIGKSCDVLSKPPVDTWTDLAPIKGFLPVIAAGAAVRPMTLDQSRFAFLTTDTADGKCVISDVVVLPDARTANALLQCDAPMPSDTETTGFGMRLAGNRKVVAYWAIDTQLHVLERVPLGVLGVEESLHCREPETGE